MSEIASRVKAIIVDKLGVEESEVTNEASFTNDLGADSLDTVELIMEFEKEFGISIHQYGIKKSGSNRPWRHYSRWQQRSRILGKHCERG